MIKTYLWKATTSSERMTIIEKVKDQIMTSGGFIIDYKMFSDLAISLVLELDFGKLDEFKNQLTKLVNLNKENEIPLVTDLKAEIRIALNITFSNSKGDLKIETPAVPG